METYNYNGLASSFHVLFVILVLLHYSMSSFQPSRFSGNGLPSVMLVDGEVLVLE